MSSRIALDLEWTLPPRLTPIGLRHQQQADPENMIKE
jgi:hypothetical protein